MMRVMAGRWGESLHVVWAIGGEGYHALGPKGAMTVVHDSVNYFETVLAPRIEAYLPVLSQELATQGEHAYNCATAAIGAWSRANFHIPALVAGRAVGKIVAPRQALQASNQVPEIRYAMGDAWYSLPAWVFGWNTGTRIAGLSTSIWKVWYINNKPYQRQQVDSEYKPIGPVEKVN